MSSQFESKFDPAIQAVVASIPSGAVMTYGEVAKQSGFPRHARMVSKALSRNMSDELPWHRVIKANHTLAFPINSENYNQQKKRLINEGCQFLEEKVIPNTINVEEDLDKLIWGFDE